jgi:hypothetical protein
VFLGGAADRSQTASATAPLFWLSGQPKHKNILAEYDTLAHGLSFARAPAWIARAVAELLHFPHACLCFSVS